MKDIPTRYDPQSIEDKWYAFWEKGNYFSPDKSQSENFSIVIPPPNVTGILHMGHALVQTVQDAVIRFERMRGKAVLWVPGTDHAGIATQNVVEKALAKEKINRHQLGREPFIQKVWEWKEKHGNIITEQMRKLGNSCDWNAERFTMDEGLSQAVKEVFLRLHEEGLIYRGKYIVNWCPRCHTALSDVEVEHVEEKGQLWHLKYPLAEPSSDLTYITVATTRPETMLGDMAVAVNPSDERYQHLIGKKIHLPIVNRDIEIIADAFVDKDFGTGAVKVTPAHDLNDFQMAERHGLHKPVILDENARVSTQETFLNIPPEFKGLKRDEARKKVVEIFAELGLLEKIEDHDHATGHCYRCQTLIEPYLSPQWFVKMKDLSGPAIQAVKDRKIEIIPTRLEKTYLDWMENLRDWCISRQIWWGHRIPVWYLITSDNEKINESTPYVVALNESEALEKAKLKNPNFLRLEQDSDVLDTWFSSALWPFSVMGWPEKTEKLKRYYPTSVLITGYDILTFWVSRMIVMGMHIMQDIPFKKVYLHGLIRTADGKKMSKSSGTAIDPLEVIKQYGTDALRFTLLSLLSSGGQDIRIAEEKIKSSRNFMNKIWNAARFIQMQETRENSKDTLGDQWIRSRLATCFLDLTDKLEKFEFGLAAQTLYQFVWSEFCDWYLEIYKLEGRTENIQSILKGILVMLHPFAPFLSEELWQLTDAKGPLIRSAWNFIEPQTLKTWLNPAIESQFGEILELITAVRTLRSNYKVDLKKQINISLFSTDPAFQERVVQNQVYIQKLAGIAQIDWQKTDQPAAFAVLKRAELRIPLADLVDPQAEKLRLNQEKEKYYSDLVKIKTQLDNSEFIKKAAPALIEKQRQAALELKEKIEKVEAQLMNLALLN